MLWGEFDAATQPHGLHTPGGRVTTTGVGGFTTGGGYGWTSSKYGLTCDNLLSAQVVLADGRIVTASERDEPDLFWGIRGGGGNFGIVTEFEYRLHPLGPLVLAGLALWPIERAGEVMRAWRDYVDQAPDELSTACVILTAPPEPFVPDSLKGQAALGIMGMYVGDPDEGARVMRPIKDLGPAVDLIQPMPYTVFQAMIDAAAPKGLRNYWRGEYLASLPDGAIDAFVQHGPALAAAATPLSQMVVFRIGQGVAAVPDDATAFSHRDARYLFHPIAVWHDAGRRSTAHCGDPCVLRRDAAVRHGRRLPELHAGGSRPRGVRRGEVRAPGGSEGPLRPRQPVPAEPEHQAEPFDGVGVSAGPRTARDPRARPAPTKGMAGLSAR